MFSPMMLLFHSPRFYPIQPNAYPTENALRFLPPKSTQVKQTSRERPLTHERPHTRNPRDPRNVLARPNAHVSPKHGHNTVKSERGADDDSRQTTGGAVSSSVHSTSSFPSLPMALTGWGGSGRSDSSPVMGVGPKMRNKGGCHGNITMAKPKDIIVEGLLR